jgi:TetR/AcrR family transcriptional regulator
MEGEARKPGERRLQILQTLAAMLQEPQAEKITTAALAARVGVSEAALYRHFSSKAQMYEGLIEFIEQTLFGLIARITADTPSPTAQIEAIISMLLNFAAKNPGMTRVLIGDALVHENERLQKRINQLHDRIEAQLRQCLRLAGDKLAERSGSLANLLQCVVVGRWHQFAKSGFTRAPGGDIELLLARLLDAHPA